MKIFLPILLLAATAFAGCTQSVASRDKHAAHVAYVARPDYFKTYRTVTGSNIPLAPGQIPNSNVSANTPPTAFARDHDSLYPTEPVVGVTPTTDPRTLNGNVGAGPAGSSPLPGGN